MSGLVERCRKAGCGARKAKPCTDWNCPQQWVPYAEHAARITELEAERDRLNGLWERDINALIRANVRAEAAEGERDTATRTLAVLDKIAWLAAEEDSWFGNENDIAVQRAAAERHSKTEGKGC